MALMYQDKVVADVGGGGAGGGSEYTAGPGIVIEGVEIREKVPVDVLQQAEYDALPEERKQNGVYFLPDGSGGGETSCGEVYSTEETRVGTWIDGKPVYEVSGTFGPVDIGTFTIHEFIDSVKIIGIHGFMYTNKTQMPLTYNQTRFYSIAYWGNNQVKIETNNNSDGKLSGVYTIRYTKTTDTAQEASE